MMTVVPGGTVSRVTGTDLSESKAAVGNRSFMEGNSSGDDEVRLFIRLSRVVWLPLEYIVELTQSQQSDLLKTSRASGMWGAADRNSLYRRGPLSDKYSGHHATFRRDSLPGSVISD